MFYLRTISVADFFSDFVFLFHLEDKMFFFKIDLFINTFSENQSLNMAEKCEKLQSDRMTIFRQLFVYYRLLDIYIVLH